MSWNCPHASSASRLWDYLLELDPDVALLQDFGTVPERILQQYIHAPNTKPLAADRAPHHMTGVLLKGTSADDLPLPAPFDWVARELEAYGEYFTAKAVTLHCGITLKVLSVYSPAFPIDPARMKEIDTTGIQLTQSRDVWATELMWAALRSMHIANEEAFIVAGDLNSSETFDLSLAGWSERKSGNHGAHECAGFLRLPANVQGQANADLPDTARRDGHPSARSPLRDAHAYEQARPVRCWIGGAGARTETDAE